MQAARRCTLQTVYRLIRSEGEDAKLVQIHPLSTINYSASPEYCIYHELVVTSKPFMRAVLRTRAEWIHEFSADKHNISRAQLYALCGRTQEDGRLSTDEGQILEKESDATKISPKELQPTRITTSAIASARERFLARKRLQQQQ